MFAQHQQRPSLLPSLLIMMLFYNSSLNVTMSLYFCLLGLECQRPKHQDRKEKDLEVVSTGTDSPELCTPDTTPPAQTPDLSPVLSNPSSPPCSPPTHHTRNACFMRQSAVDEQGGAEIQVLVEGRGMDTMRSGANSWTTEMYPHRRGSKGESSRSTTPSLLEEEIGHVNGHENSSTHHPWENGSSNHKPIEHMAPEKVWDQMSSNQKPWKHVSLNPKSREHTISREREREHKPSTHKSVDCDSSKFKPQVHIYSNHTLAGHNLSNHKTNEHASSNHKPKEFISAHENHTFLTIIIPKSMFPPITNNMSMSTPTTSQESPLPIIRLVSLA